MMKAATAPASDTSFMAQGKEYQVKLIYLPDYSRPFSVSIWSGIGSVQMKVALQDGWMLTSLDGSADSKVSETLTALASIASSIAGATSGGAAAGGKQGKGNALGILSLPAQNLLKPGLYEFKYDGEEKFVGLFAVTYFCDDGPMAVASGQSWSQVCEKPDEELAPGVLSPSIAPPK